MDNGRKNSSRSPNNKSNPRSRSEGSAKSRSEGSLKSRSEGSARSRSEGSAKSRSGGAPRSLPDVSSQKRSSGSQALSGGPRRGGPAGSHKSFAQHRSSEDSQSASGRSSRSDLNGARRDKDAPGASEGWTHSPRKPKRSASRAPKRAHYKAPEPRVPVPGEENMVRLNKYLSMNGISSRRHADKLIEEGSITMNGKKVFEMGTKVDPTKDRVSVNGKPLKIVDVKIYLAFHKPKEVMTTMSDPEGRPCIGNYCEGLSLRVFPVGRLDYDSEGLIILTNDGEFANKVTHPSGEVTKTYLVKVSGKPDPKKIQKLRDGVSIIGGKVSAKHIEKIKMKDGSEQYEWYKIIITEGKNRQIRQMFAKINLDVMKLQRVCIGRLKLGSLRRGELRGVSELDLEKVFLADDPEELKDKKSAYRRKTSAKRAPTGNFDFKAE